MGVCRCLGVSGSSRNKVGKPARTSRGHAFHDVLMRVMRRRAMGGGHVMRRDAERVRDEMSGIGPGPSGHRDGVGTGRGMSHNTVA